MDKDSNNSEQQETSPSPYFRVWLCGPFRVERLVGCAGLAPIYEVVRSADWSGSTLPRLLLKLLLCLPRRQVRREAIVDLLWPDVDPEQATQYIHTATTKLRKVLQRPAGPGSLLLSEDDALWYRLEGQDLIWTDVDAALAALSEAERIGYLLPEALPFLE